LVGALLMKLSASVLPAVPLGAGAAHGAAAAASAALHVTGALGGHTALSHAAGGAVSHAMGGHALSAAATLKTAAGATTAVVVAPSPERPQPQSRQLQAVTKILQIEFARFKSAVFRDGVNSDPVEVATRVQETAVTRAPIIKWALNLWVRGTLRQTQASVDHTTYRKALSGAVVEGYEDFTRGQVPGIVDSLQELRAELLREVRYGFSTAPLRVVKLLLTSLVVTVLAFMAKCARLPGLRFVRAGMRANWPQLVEHLAATLEMNLAETERLMMAPGTGVSALPPLLLPAPSGELLQDLKERIERATGIDLDGDGHVGKPPVQTQTESVGFRERVRNLGGRTRAAVGGAGGEVGFVLLGACRDARCFISRLLMRMRMRRRGRAEFDTAAVVFDLPERSVKSVHLYPESEMYPESA